LVGVVRKDSDLEKLKDQFKANPNVHILNGDVSSLDSMLRVATQVKELGIIPDLLVCNAGVLTPPRRFNEISREDMRLSFEVNVLGPHNGMTAFMPLMQKVEGAVMVNVSSGWGLWGEAGQASYCATKHALEGLVKCAALDYEHDPISIVTVRPGVVNTDMLAVAVGGREIARQKGVDVKRFADHFCERIMSITKADSGSHIDCGLKQTTV
jgi:NAD(P)-dependent dehydrogenase (short-subunit alcohol dehydrogenase family)